MTEPWERLQAEQIELARAALRRFATEELSPAELAVESERWEQHLRVLKVRAAEDVDPDYDTRTLQAGIAYAEHRLEQITRQLGWFIRASRRTDQPRKADFSSAKYADLVGLAETLLSEPARRTGNRHRIRCPFHEDRRPSLIIYPPGEGWWCPVCGKGGQDAASFCAEYFHCSQLEGLRWVEQLADGVGAG